MKESKNEPGMVSTCFEGPACAELIQKITGEEGLGSLSEEMMRSSVRICCESQEPPQETGTMEVDEGKNDQELKTAQGQNNEKFTGGVK